MSAGMIPAFDLPGDAIPGQFGPTIPLAFPLAYAGAQNTAGSRTARPPLIATISGTRASIASITAALVPAGGTNTTETSAPVAAIVSATVPNTGTAVPPRSTVWPALRGLWAPTTFVPAASILRACLVPSEPVMPWIMTRLSPVRKIAMSRSCLGRVAAMPISYGSTSSGPTRSGPTRSGPIDPVPIDRLPGGGQLRGAARRIVHGGDLFDHGQACFVQDAASLGCVVTVQPHHDRVVHLLAALPEQADGGNDAFRDRVAGGDAAEHVDQDTADRCVGQHDLQAVGHHLGGSPAADVEEVRRLDPAELLARLGHHVQRGHDQPGAVADDPHLAVELHVVEVLGLGPGLQRVGRPRVSEPGMVLPEGRVVVQGHLAVHREHMALLGQRQGVDLDQRGVLVGEHRPEPLGENRGLPGRPGRPGGRPHRLRRPR